MRLFAAPTTGVSGDVIQTTDEQHYVDCSALDASHYPATAITGYDGRLYVLNARMPAGATGVDDVVIDADTLLLRAMTTAERAARDAAIAAADRAERIAAIIERTQKILQVGVQIRALYWGKLTASQQSAWGQYAQALLDYLNAGDPYAIYPQAPALPEELRVLRKMAKFGE